jgi:hypothetical protein
VGLKDDVTAILRDEHCRSMNFTIAGLTVNGAGLQEVAAYLANDRIAVCGRDDMSTPGRYRFTRDELHVRSDLNDGLEKDASKRSLIVHEAVHALADIRGLSQMTSIQSESSGFIAQALYRLKFRNGRAWRSTVPVHAESLSVVTTLRLHERSGVTVQWDDYAGLRRAIRDHPNYTDDDHDASAGATGVRRHRGGRCQA